MKSTKKKMKIGLLTAGGDCPGINAAIRGVSKTAIVKYGMQVLGFAEGFRGILDKEYQEITEERLSGILTLGGTILGTSRVKPFKTDNSGNRVSHQAELIVKNYKQMGLDCLICIGGNGTMETAYLFSQEGLNVIGIPKTIDNDVWGTDVTFGFDSAVGIATEAIDRLHTTANSHRRIMVIEVMGHNAGWLALYSGVAAGGDVILIPEIPHSEKRISEYLIERSIKSKQYSIVVVAEGIEKPANMHAAQYICSVINKIKGMETRQTILGYIQRGGTPSAADRILATRYGSHATELIANERYGVMVAQKEDRTVYVPLSETGGKVRKVPPDHSLVIKARSMNTCFGD
jgi:ATP-dependent phosphofructokinase / diphosphate-dependent phosphofructokinase